MQIKFKVDKGKNSKPVISQFEVKLSADMVETEVGFKGNNKMNYGLNTQWEQIFNLKNGIITQDDVLESKKGPLDIKKYDTAMMDILFAITNAMEYSLANRQ